MADDSLAANRSRRSRSDRSGRQAALEKFKAVKSGQRAKYDLIENDDNLFEEVTEEEYNQRVSDRRSNFVVDENGDYKDNGYEIFDEEYEEAEEEERKNKPKVSYKAPKGIRKKRQDAAKSGNIRSMFLAAPHKRKAENASLEDDKLLEQLMKAKGLNADDDDEEENIPRANPKKKQKSEVSVNPFASVKKPQNIKPPPRPKPQGDAPIPGVSANGKTPAAEEANVQSTNFPDEEDSMSSMPDVSVADDTRDEKTPANELVGDVKVPDENTVREEDDPKPVVPTIKAEEVSQLEGPSSAGGFKEVNMNSFNEDDFDDEPEVKPQTAAKLPADLPVSENPDGETVFRLFWLDAYEEPYAHPGTVYVFGKTTVSNSSVSAAIVVKNIPRKLFFLPRERENENGMMCPIPFKSVYDEVKEVLKQHGIKEFRCKESEKMFVFATQGVPRKANYLEVQYNPAKAMKTLPGDLSGQTFSKVFGTSTSSLEALILDRKLKGPSWLDVKQPESAHLHNTTCKFEIDCQDLKNISVSSVQAGPPALSILTLQARAVRNEKNSRDEVVMVAGLVHDDYPLTKPPPAKLFTQHFCFVTTSSDRSLPYDFKKELASERIKIKPCENERMLISQLNSQMTKCDPDIIVGHDASSFTLPAILTAMERHKIVKPSALSRLCRSNIQSVNVSKLDRTQLLPGRVICDTKLSAKELIQAKSYELSDLVSDVLNANHDEISADAFKEMLSRTPSLKVLCKHIMHESQFVIKLLAELNILPLASQITTICGNTLTQTLQKGRALRNEYLLLHAFTSKNFIVPDKESRRAQKKKQQNEADEGKTGDKKKGPAYSGGLVLDPIVGFYDSMVLLMDFNSLYPSIIQEYNLCFTTCALTPPEDNAAAAEADWEAQIPPATVDTGVLPFEIRKLVENRRTVKDLLKTPNLSREKKLQYDIRQKALKLTANSMYGCLGFQGSRFYAKPIAALITQRGRDILMSAKSMAESMGYSIIYGDTDSIMINTCTRDIAQVKEIGKKLSKAINDQYKRLEIEVDGVFKSMLLLKKKKYAAHTLTFLPDGSLAGGKIEVKGLDIVRRDWSELARKTGRFVVDTLLKGELSADDAVDAVHDHLREVGKKVNDNALPFEDYVITKQLTKNVEDYPDAKNQSHVLVAKRFNARGAKKLRAGDTVQYVICEDGTENPHTQRAYSKEEMESKEFANKLTVDRNYYLTQQVFPVVSRLIEPIRGTDAAVVAQCLGLDPSKYNRRTNFDPSGMVDSELAVGISLLLPQSLDSDLFQNVEAFTVNCTKCDNPISVDGFVFKNMDGQTKFLFSDCGKCHSPLLPQVDQLCNQLTKQLQQLQLESEKIMYICQMCDHRVLDVLCNLHEEEIPVCPACGEDTLRLQAQAFQTYAQLRYWGFMFDLEYNREKFPNAGELFESEAVRVIVESFKMRIDKFLQCNGFSNFSLRSYMEKLPSCNFTKRPIVSPDLDIP
ncbi:DNA polymerase alpha catalytic subunit [Galendromus occidentalis]|uniref:DNA polymerase n=1 Tax=Galendromus occidentalis TaxID=34638 RepID=A0AAJ7WHP2_9ACAR|nr:DNA polymerase alpha catalytic subunit [Galendromus occidentalis]